MSSPSSLLLPENGDDWPIRMRVLVTPWAWAALPASKQASAPTAAVSARIVVIAPPPRYGKSAAEISALRLFQKLAAAADHRQIDEFRAAVAARRETDHKFAQIHIVHALERRDELFTRQVLAGALEALDHHLGDDEPFQAREIEVRVARLGHYFLVFLHDRYARAPGEGNDLRDCDSIAIVLERVGKCLAAYKRNVVELS